VATPLEPRKETRMPSLYKVGSRMDPYDARMQNLAKARASARYHPPRPWRSKEESQMVQRFAFQWWTCRDRGKPSARSWAKGLGVSHVWVLKLVRRFQTDPILVDRMAREVRRRGDPTLEQLRQARERTQWMRERGELRSSTGTHNKGK
jgi:hypothetical protein